MLVYPTNTIRSMTFTRGFGMTWERATKLDAPTLLAAVAAATGTVLTYDGPCPGGEVGAAYVCWPDGHRSVLTWQPDVAVERVIEISRALATAVAAGLPVPEYELVVPVPGAVAVVQRLMPGASPPDLDAALAEAMIATNRRFAGLLAGSGVAAAELYLTRGGGGFCLHGPLAAYSRRTARLLDWIEEVGRSVPEHMTGDDLVHLDFHHGNVLVEGGRITGIVDWDGAARGDHRFDLVTLRFAVPPGRADLAARLDAELDARLTADELRPYWASMALRQVDWAIRHHGDDLVTHHLDLAEPRVD